jgi:putative PIN family toxin of toxin-antitoxin system
MSQDEIRRIIIDIMQISEILVSESKFEVIEEDPDDDIVLNVAYDSRADYIVSGDKHLLKLREFKGTKIVSVKGILTILQQ